MTNEEAKMFLDNLKVCIDEHPVVADWLVEIADRKTENSSEKPNNSTISKMEQVEEPQSNADQRIQDVESVEPMQMEREGE